MSRAGLSAEVRSAVLPAARRETDVRFHSFVENHLDFVWRLFRRLGLSAADADDASQQVLVIAARRFQRVEPGRERAFLYGTTRRVLANFRRSVRRRRETGEEAMRDLATPAPLPDELLDRQAGMGLLDRVLSQLPDPLRRVLVLAEIEELTTPQIAELERIPAGTVASRLRRARAAFREELARAKDLSPGAPTDD